MQNLLVGSRCPSFVFFLYVVFRARSFAYNSPTLQHFKNIVGAATMFELSRLFTRGSGNPLSVAAVLIKLMLSPPPTQIMCYYVFAN